MKLPKVDEVVKFSPMAVHSKYCFLPERKAIGIVVPTLEYLTLVAHRNDSWRPWTISEFTSRMSIGHGRSLSHAVKEALRAIGNRTPETVQASIAKAIAEQQTQGTILSAAMQKAENEKAKANNVSAM